MLVNDTYYINLYQFEPYCKMLPLGYSLIKADVSVYLCGTLTEMCYEVIDPDIVTVGERMKLFERTLGAP